ncbi:FAD binding domain-containing protein [Arenibaculum pallidiluteum]|uniref:FAD binding domain-containing protein n=1 Tax=Arenibaculum pallidiluteum TaxID=2812559 RepID=UPI001A958284|nr:FAD binding domain-containing protein [Arenibaculum pallidiluteum]
MKGASLAYARANDVSHALELWRRAGPDARLLAGGQSLLAGINLRLNEIPGLIDISRIGELRGVADLGDRLRIGALTRHADLQADPLVAAHAPAFAQAAPLIAHAAIRTRGTIGGSLAYADPAAELPACVLALDAEIVLRAEAGERRVAAENFFLGLFETALRPFEMIVAVEVPKIGPNRRHAVLELARRSGDYAMAGLVLAADVAGGRLHDVRLSYFSMGPAPVLARGAMAALDSDEGVEAACAALGTDLDPVADLQGGPEMKRHLAGVLLHRAVAGLLGHSPVSGGNHGRG